MKKFLRFYLPIFIIFICLGFYSVTSYENALKCILNTKQCRVVSTKRNAIVKIDGTESANSKIFEDERNYYLVSDAYKRGSFSLMIIDKSKNAVTYPECYAMIYSSHLLLPDCVSGIFLSDKVKGNGFDTRLKISDSGVSFVIPGGFTNFRNPEHDIEILFRGE